MDPSIGFIGLGVMAHRMLANMATLGGFRCRCAWDPNPEACRRTAERFPGLEIGPSAQAVIEHPEIEVVYIACPPAFHAGYARAAAEAGKAVFCEKPLTIDLKEGRALVADLEARGTRNAVNFPFADAAAVSHLLRGLEDGSLGAVQAADVRLHFCKWPRDWQEPADWLCRREQGGFVRETFSHYVYLLHRLLGPLRLEQAITRFPDDGLSAETRCLALYDCGGVPVTFAGGIGGPDSSAADRVECTLWGSKRAVRLYDWNRLRDNDGGGWHESPSQSPDPREDGYRRMLLNLGRFLRGEDHTMPSFRDALEVQEVVEATLAQVASDA